MDKYNSNKNKLLNVSARRRKSARADLSRTLLAYNLSLAARDVLIVFTPHTKDCWCVCVDGRRRHHTPFFQFINIQCRCRARVFIYWFLIHYVWWWRRRRQRFLRFLGCSFAIHIHVHMFTWHPFALRAQMPTHANIYYIMCALQFTISPSRHTRAPISINPNIRHVGFQYKM